MKRILLLALSIFLCFAILAQIEVESADFPGKSDTVRYTNILDFQLDFQSAGPDFTWDFSQLTDNSQLLLKHNPIEDADLLTQSLFGPAVLPIYRTTYFLPASAIPFDQISNFLDLPIDNFFRHYRRTAAEMTVIGLSISTPDFGFGARADTIEVAYQFPITFGQQFESRGYTNIDLSFALPAQFKQYRQRASEVDGWGEITTPYGTFEVLRVHNIINELDSIYLELNGAGTWLPLDLPISHEYEWWAKDQKGPILRVVTTEIGGFEQVTEARYRDVYKANLVANISENNQDRFTVYPNPTEGLVTISSQESIDQLIVFDSAGKVVLQASSTNQINLELLENGTYFLFIKSGDAVSVEQLIKQI